MKSSKKQPVGQWAMAGGEAIRTGSWGGALRVAAPVVFGALGALACTSAWAQSHYQYITAKSCVKVYANSPTVCEQGMERELPLTKSIGNPSSNDAHYASTIASFDNHGTLASIVQIGDGTDKATSEGTVAYTFTLEATDPTAPLDLVPLHVQAGGIAEGNGDGYVNGRAEFHLLGFDGKSLSSGVAIDTSGTDRILHTFGIDEWIFIQPQLLTVNLYTSVTFESAVNARGTVNAAVDPVFTIAPEYASRYRLVDLPGSVVPEPGTWALMVGGLAAAGAVRRWARRR